MTAGIKKRQRSPSRIVKGKRGKNSQSAKTPKNTKVAICYKTKNGLMVVGSAENALKSQILRKYRRKVQLIFTSPPFPLNRKKKYGNLTGKKYSDWLANFALLFRDYLTKDGSIVIELGNAWEPGKPIMSTLAIEALLGFLKSGDLNLCQQFVAYNKARLPGPAQWVNIERIRVKDAYTNIWWMSPIDRPKADNTRVLKKYSSDMVKLLSSGKYNPGKRPSEHNIGAASFLRQNKGAIPSNVLVFSNTNSNDNYMRQCRKKGKVPHPARMPRDIAEFFINFLTEPGDIVLDPFAGSNTTGYIAERQGRKWISIEKDRKYAKESRIRFNKDEIKSPAKNPAKHHKKTYRRKP